MSQLPHIVANAFKFPSSDLPRDAAWTTALLSRENKVSDNAIVDNLSDPKIGPDKVRTVAEPASCACRSLAQTEQRWRMAANRMRFYN
jgi:hypothetical protein